MNAFSSFFDSYTYSFERTTSTGLWHSFALASQPSMLYRTRQCHQQMLLSFPRNILHKLKSAYQVAQNLELCRIGVIPHHWKRHLLWSTGELWTEPLIRHTSNYSIDYSSQRYIHGLPFRMPSLHPRIWKHSVHLRLLHSKHLWWNDIMPNLYLNFI